jgi:phosphoribosylaminoimidazole carboxylase (NCAIR synthetase)
MRLILICVAGSTSPAGQISELCVEGQFHDNAKIEEFASICDVITVDRAHVDPESLKVAEETTRVCFRPSSAVISLLQVSYGVQVLISTP